eukprot:gene3164-13862_t
MVVSSISLSNDATSLIVTRMEKLRRKSKKLAEEIRCATAALPLPQTNATFNHLQLLAAEITNIINHPIN